MVDKLIRGRIIEIIIVLLFVLVSIPIWKAFQERYSMANVTTMDEYNLKFKVNKYENTDNLLVQNDYYLFKNFKVFLKVDDNLDENTQVIINGIVHSVDEFSKEKKNNEYLYTLLVDSMYGGIKNYSIDVILANNNVNYNYVLEEIYNF